MPSLETLRATKDVSAGQRLVTAMMQGPVDQTLSRDFDLYLITLNVALSGIALPSTTRIRPSLRFFWHMVFILVLL